MSSDEEWMMVDSDEEYSTVSSQCSDNQLLDEENTVPATRPEIPRLQLQKINRSPDSFSYSNEIDQGVQTLADVDVAAMLDNHTNNKLDFVVCKEQIVKSAATSPMLMPSIPISINNRNLSSPISAFTLEQPTFYHRDEYSYKNMEAGMKTSCTQTESPLENVPVYTPIKPFTKNQDTQTNFSSKTEVDGVRTIATKFYTSCLSSALQKSMESTTRLQAKSHECELEWARNFTLQKKLDRANETIAKQEQQLNEALCRLEMCLIDKESQATRRHFMSIPSKEELDDISTNQLEDLEDTLMEACDVIHSTLNDREDTAVNHAMKFTRVSSKESQHTDKKCVVCIQRLACVEIDPCHHRVVCSECVLKLEKCPLDGRRIDCKKLTYGLNDLE